MVLVNIAVSGKLRRGLLPSIRLHVRGVKPIKDPPALRSAAAVCPHALARGDAPNLGRELLGEPEVAIRSGRDAERRSRGDIELGDGACCSPGGSCAQAQQADRDQASACPALRCHRSTPTHLLTRSGVGMRPCGSALSLGFPASFLAQHPARQARLKERGGPDALSRSGVLGCVQLGAGESCVVVSRSPTARYWSLVSRVAMKSARATCRLPVSGQS